MNETERLQQLIALANSWLEDAQCLGMFAFIPNDEASDKIARNRTEACARQLLRVLAGCERYNGRNFERIIP